MPVTWLPLAALRNLSILTVLTGLLFKVNPGAFLARMHGGEPRRKMKKKKKRNMVVMVLGTEGAL